MGSEAVPRRSITRSRDAVDARRERRSAGLGRGRGGSVIESKLTVLIGREGNKDENIGEGVRGKSSWIMSKTLLCQDCTLVLFALVVADWAAVVGDGEGAATAVMPVESALELKIWASSIEDADRGGMGLLLCLGCGGLR